MSDKTDNSESNETKELDVTKTQTNQSKSSTTTPASSVTGIPPVSKLKVPSNFGGSIGSISKIGRLCSHAAPKAGPPPRDSTSMSRESDDHFNSFNSTHTDLYQETIKRFTRSSLSPEMDRFSTSRFSFRSNVKSPQSSEANRRRSSYDFYVEATGRRRSSDQGAVLTQDTEQFIIGQKVWVGGIRPGQIAYIGETHFAPGEWAGVVLDEPNGKNDGCVAGKRYFQCEPKRGIFSRLTRLTLAPLAGIQTPTSPLQKNSPERSRTGSPTTSIRSSYVGKHGLTVGDRVIVSSGFGSRPGILRYLGETKFATGNWCGVELDEATGKNDGSVDGVRYFECKPKYGVFVPIAKVSLSPSSKKSRLSRTGSRESLTSIGTMNSIATTNTSRLRMSSQRKSPTIKPMATPKHQFTMQELLRDKQSHIEQLMIERELDREDAQSQALQYQKNINELKTRIAQLEHQLIEERKKAEDLQFSIDEATFCGDELSAQTQVYREKIQDLENKIKQLTSTNNSTPQHSPTSAFEIKIVELETKLKEQSNLYETQKSKLHDELQRLQENIKYLRSENENLQKELVAKDEAFEKFSLSESGLANMRHELDLLKQEHEKERSHIVKDFTVKLAEKAEEAQQLSKEVMSLKNIISSAEHERCNVEEKCQVLEAECQNRNEEIEKLTDKLAKMSSELAVREAECSTLDDIIKTQQTEQAKEKQTEIDKLTQNKASLETMNSKLEKDLQELNKDLQNVKEVNSAMKSEIIEITKNEKEKDEILMNLESQLNMINKERESLISTNEELNKTLKDISQMFEKEKSIMKQLTTSVNEKDLQLTKTTQELALNKNLVVQLKAQIDELNNTSEQKINVKLQEINALQQQLTVFQDKSTHLESNTALVVQQLNNKISDLDKRNKILEEDYNNSQALNKELQQRLIKHDELLAEKASELKSNELALENTNNVLEKIKKEYEIAVSSYRLVEEQLKSSEEKNAQYQLNVSDLERKLETFTTKCDTLIGQNETLQQDVLTARTSCSKMQNALKRLNEEIASKQTALSNLESAENDQRIRMEGEIEELKQKLTKSNQSIVDLKEGATKLKQEIEQKNRKFSELEEKCVKQELMISDNHRQRELIQNKCEILLKENDALQKDIDNLRTTTVDSSSELTKLSQDLNTQRKTYDDLLDRSNSERATLESQLQARHQRIDALCSQVETLTEELKITHETSLERFELLKQQEEKIRKQELEANDVARKLESLAAKYENLQTQNANLQSELSSLRSGSADTNAEFVKLTEELTAKQKAFQELEDKTNSERHSYQNQIQELKQTMQTQQHEMDQLQQQVITLNNSKLSLSQEFETVKRELLAKAQQEVEELKSTATLKQNKLKESFEIQLKNSEKHKISLEEGISSLQQQIHVLQEEMLKSQIAYKTKEAELQRQVEVLTHEKEQLGEILTKTESDKCQALENLQQEETQLMQRLEGLAKDLNEKNIALTQAQCEIQQMRISESNNKTDHQLELQKLQNSLDLLKSESEHKNKLLGEDRQKIAELKSMIEALKTSNQNISTTNAQLAAALEHLEQEKCETNNIFELFEMESDQNMNKLVETLTNLKQELNNTRLQLGFMQTELKEKEERIQGANELLQKSELNLNGCQKEMLEKTTKLQELHQANHELTTRIDELEKTIKQQNDLKLQLDEYKTIVDEMDDSSKEKSSNFYKLQQELQQLEVDKVKVEGKEKELQKENKTLQRKLELMEFEKTREIVVLQGRINDLQTFAHIKQSNGTNDHHVALPPVSPITEDSAAHINFLNSIIADMQKKNDTLKAKIEALEAIPTDFTKPHVFDLIAKRKPTPRLFCDICDEFDKHETEDCPLQASDDREYSPPPTSTPKKDRKLPEPRKYCENCEVFGHDTAQCDDDECY